MSEELNNFGDSEARRIANAVRWVESQSLRQPASRGKTDAAVQLVEITGTLDGDTGLYPGNVVTYTHDGDVTNDLGEVRVKCLNGETLSEGQTVLCRFSGPDESNTWGVYIPTLNSPTMLAQCVSVFDSGGDQPGGALASWFLGYGADSVGRTTRFPLRSVLVDMPQDKTSRTYLVIACVSLLLTPTDYTPDTPEAYPSTSSIFEQITVDSQVTMALSEDGSTVTTPADENWHTKPFMLHRSVRSLTSYSGTTSGGHTFTYNVPQNEDRGAVYGTMTFVQTYDASLHGGIADGTAVPETGVNTPPAKTCIMFRLMFNAILSTVNFDVGSDEVTFLATIYDSSLRVIQVDKISESASACGPVGDPEVPDPPEGTHRVDITIDTDGGGGGSILGGVTVTITNSSPAVVNVTATTSSFPFVYTLYLPDDSYTVTAVNTIGGASRTVTSGTFGVSGGDVGTGQIIT